MQSERASCYTLVNWEDMAVKTEKWEKYFFYPVSSPSQNQGPFFQSRGGPAGVGRGGWGGEERKINHQRMRSLCPFEVFIYILCLWF